MGYQPGRRNFTVRTGADNVFALRFYRQGDLVDASTIIAGDYVEWDDGNIWPVHSATVAGAGKVTLKLGRGAAFDPERTFNDDDQIPKSVPSIWEVADMQVALPDTVETPPPSTLPVPTTIEDDGAVCVIRIDQTWLEPFQRAIDYSSGGPSGMSLPYDLVGLFDDQRIPVLTGSINIVRSAASPVVTPPEEVIP